MLGEDGRNHQKFYWEFGHKKLNNRHLLINGASGCGKTYCIQGLLQEASQQGISAVIFDYTGGFTSSQMDSHFKEVLSGHITQRIVIQEGLPVNPFKLGKTKIDEDIFVDDRPSSMGNKIAEIFGAVYGLGDQQRSAIYSATVDGINAYGEKMSFPLLRQLLEDQETAPA